MSILIDVILHPPPGHFGSPSIFDELLMESTPLYVLLVVIIDPFDWTIKTGAAFLQVALQNVSGSLI